MPLLPPTVALTLMPNLLATGHAGFGMPVFAQGVANGICLWAAQASVVTTGTGAAGTGVAAIPFAVPQPLLYSSLQTSFLAAGVVGIVSPLTVLGLANGCAAALPLGIMTTTVIGVGSGSGISKIISGPSFPIFQAAFTAQGMVGPAALKVALGLGLAFDQVFAGFFLPTPIVGPSGPAPGAGTGTGKIL